MTKFAILLLLPYSLLIGQDRQKEINDQVWKPFIKTFSENNAEGFMDLHSKDLVRSPRDGKVVLNWNEYLANSKKGADRDKAANRNKKIELKFIERIASAEQAIDIGIYKTSYINPDGSTRDFYGKFLVVLRKEDGIWKILVDTDSSEGGTIDEKSFLSADAMER